jgi:putative aldouronate transport system permease protein
VLYPLIYVLSCSISSPDLVAAGKVIFFPRGITLAGYKRVFQDSNILTGYKNTLFYTVAGTIINLIVTVPAGYALAKKELPGRNFFMYFFMFTMYFGGGMIPTFLLIKNLGLYNTRTILLILGAFSTYNCIICRTFFAAIPKELEEAAVIDGSSPFRTFLQIILPTSQALLGVMVLYFAVAHWNSYFSALMYTSDDKIKPLQLFLRKILILQEASSSMLEGLDDDVIAEQTKLKELIKYSVIVVSSLPVLILYPFLQKYFAQGVMIGSLKG